MRERIKLINEYLENYENLTESAAKSIALRTIKNQSSLIWLYSRHFKKLKSASSAIEAAKFSQLENYVQSTILLAITEQLPFIGID